MAQSAKDSIFSKSYSFHFDAPNLVSEWRTFVQMFQAYLKETDSLNKPEAIKIAMLMSFLGHDAIPIFNEFKFNTESDSNCLEVVINKFEAYCNLRKNVVSERFAFWRLSQQADETIDAFVSKLQEKARTCGFGEQLEDLIRDKVVLGCLDETLLEIFLREDDMSLEQVLKICRSAESSKAQKKITSGKTNAMILTVNHTGYSQTNLKAMEVEQKLKLCSNCGGIQTPSKCLVNSKFCSACEKSNHCAQFCQFSGTSTSPSRHSRSLSRPTQKLPAICENYLYILILHIVMWKYAKHTCFYMQNMS